MKEKLFFNFYLDVGFTFENIHYFFVPLTYQRRHYKKSKLLYMRSTVYNLYYISRVFYMWGSGTRWRTTRERERDNVHIVLCTIYILSTKPGVTQYNKLSTCLVTTRPLLDNLYKELYSVPARVNVYNDFIKLEE